MSASWHNINNSNTFDNRGRNIPIVLTKERVNNGN